MSEFRLDRDFVVFFRELGNVSGAGVVKNMLKDDCNLNVVRHADRFEVETAEYSEDLDHGS